MLCLHILVLRTLQQFMMESSFYYQNGNDAAELLSNGQSTEVYGVIGEDPDTNGGGCNGHPNCWDTEDGWAYKVKVNGHTQWS